MALGTGLGRLYDIGLAVAPVDLATAGITGKRISLQDCSGVDIVLIYAAGTDNDDPVPSLQQHTASVSGVTTTLATMTTIWRKAETLLDNDEPWVETTQAAAAIMTAVTDDAQKQKIYVIHVSANALADGYTHVSVNQADPGSNAQLVAGLYIKVDLQVQRRPSRLPNLLNPGAVNA